MRIVNCEQGTKEWLDARLGVITASRAKEAMTKGRGKDKAFGDTAMSYMYELIGETLTGQSPIITNIAMEWGTEHEPYAREAYEAAKGVKVEEVGFVLHQDSELIGCSPDGLVEDGLIEIKCPYTTKNHIRHIIEGIPAQYMMQMQFQMWVCEKSWCDFVSYDPRMILEKQILHIQRVERDAGKYCFDQVEAFAIKMAELLEAMNG